jgi:hypothetical protein
MPLKYCVHCPLVANRRTLNVKTPDSFLRMRRCERLGSAIFCYHKLSPDTTSPLASIRCKSLLAEQLSSQLGVCPKKS